MPVKSSIMIPDDGAKFDGGTIAVRGIAWAGEEAIERVDISFDGGSRWQPADLSLKSCISPGGCGMWIGSPRAPDTTRFFRAPRIPRDACSRLFPRGTPRVILWNGIDRIGVTVEAKA